MHDHDLLAIYRQISHNYSESFGNYIRHVHIYSTVVPHLPISHLYVFTNNIFFLHFITA